MSDNKAVFIIYAQADRDQAERLARELVDKGQEVWWDQWEVAAGDSLISKIFTEGLGKASAFVILLSAASIRSKWVQEELNTATIRRIEDLTRVIPALVGDVSIPMPLRTLRWVDLRKDFEGGTRQILNAINGVSEKPTLGAPPPHIEESVKRIEGLSKLAALVATLLLTDNDPDASDVRALDGAEISVSVELRPEEVNDAVDELEASGLAKVIRALGTAPYSFAAIEPTYLLYMAASDRLGYDPQSDIESVIATVASTGSADGPQLTDATGLSPGRLNRAVEYVRDQGLAEILRSLGTHPFSFGVVEATRRTRQAARN